MGSETSSMSAYPSMDTAMATSPQPKPSGLLESADSGGLSGVFTWASTSMKQILNGGQNGVRRLLKPGMQRTDSREDSDMGVSQSERPADTELVVPEPQDVTDSSMDAGHLPSIGNLPMDLQVSSLALSLMQGWNGDLACVMCLHWWCRPCRTSGQPAKVDWGLVAG